MAELAIGILGLSGLFTVTMEVWSFVDAGRGFYESSGVFQSKLELQRLNFIIWGHNIGFRSPLGYEPALDDPEIRPTIISTLRQIQRLLSDTDQLSKKYGLKARSHKESTCVPSRTLSAQFYESFRQLARISLRRRLEQGSDFTAADPEACAIESSPNGDDLIRQWGEAASVWTRMTWACMDQTKAEQLIDDLSYFVKGLHELTNNLHLTRRFKRMSSDVKSVLQYDKLPQFVQYNERENRIRPEGLSVLYDPVHMAAVVE
jgi:hypothetical protein